MLSCIGDLTNKKQEALLFLTVSILTINVVNIVILEVGEWHFFMTSNIQEIIGQKNLKKMVFYGIVYLWSILRQASFFAQSSEFKMNAYIIRKMSCSSICSHFISGSTDGFRLILVLGITLKFHIKVCSNFYGSSANRRVRTVQAEY